MSRCVLHRGEIRNGPMCSTQKESLEMGRCVVHRGEIRNGPMCSTQERDYKWADV